LKRCRLTDGQQLRYLDIGQGPPLVLLHGWGMSSAIFADTIQALAEEFRLLIPDLRGHGHSEPGQDYRLDSFVSDIQSWLDSLQIESCRLIGWSFGGQIALKLAATALLPIERMVLVSSTPKFCQSADWAFGLPAVQVRAMQRQFQRDPVATLDEFVAMMFAGDSCATALAMKGRESSILPDFEAGKQTLTTLEVGDLRGALGDIQTPTLVHHGKSDMIIPVSAGAFLAEQIPNAVASLWDNVGHAPFLSAPERSRSLWKEFLL